MNNLKWFGPLAGLALAAIATTANATPTNTQTEFLVNGASALATGIDAATGLGTRSFTFNKSGSYDVRAFFDLDLSLPETGFANEYGSIYNETKLKTGQSWEIDEPGYNGGNLYSNFMGSGFKNSNDIPGLEDVGIGMGWSFALGDNQQATLYFTASNTAGGDSLFYLGQFDAFDANGPVYFYSDLKIESTENNPVPEPSTFVLLGSALAGLGLYGRKRRRS